MNRSEEWAPPEDSPRTLTPPTLAGRTDLQIALLSLLELPLDELEVLLDIGLRRRRRLREQEASKQPRLRVAA